MEDNDCVRGVLNFKPFLPTGGKEGSQSHCSHNAPSALSCPWLAPLCDSGNRPQQDEVDTH